MADFKSISRRNFVRDTGLTLTALTLSGPSLEALVLQQPRVVSVQEAINDENNLTGTRQLYINQEADWVMRRIAETISEKKVYWMDKFVYDHTQEKARSQGASHSVEFLKTPGSLGEDIFYGVLSGALDGRISIGERESAFFFPTTFDRIYQSEYSPPQLKLSDSIGPSEETIRMHVAGAVNSGFSAYHEINLGNGLRIDKSNANTIGPNTYSVITTTDKLIRDIEFARKYLSKQAADFAVAGLVNFAIHVSGYRIKENAQSEYERRLLQANEDRMLPLIKQYVSLNK